MKRFNYHYHLVPSKAFEPLNTWPDISLLPKTEDRIGLTVTSGIVTILKDEENLIGISIGGGAPHCPCLYIVQVFDNTPTSKDGTLEAGDELLAVNGESCKGKTKLEVAKLIQSSKEKVIVKYNKLHSQEKKEKSLDILLKKVKHRMVENMSSSTADALGLSRAILCNDSLIKKLEELNSMEITYKGIIEHTRHMLKAYLDMFHVYKAFGDVFAEIGVKEIQHEASEAFGKFGENHRLIEKRGIEMLRNIKPILSDLSTFFHKAIPDTKLTIKKYADSKFEYLSYCLKVKEMDDEECTYQALQEPLYRVETGNYKYRLILRCRQEARAIFAQMRSDVLVKLELLEHKHMQDIVIQMQRLMQQLAAFHQDNHLLQKDQRVFPIEMDLSKSSLSFTKETAESVTPDPLYEYHDEEEETSIIEEGGESEESRRKNEETSEMVEHLALQKELFEEFGDLNLQPTVDNTPDLLCLD